MEHWFNKKKPSWEEQKSNLLETFFREPSYVLVGPVAVHLQCSLKEAENALDQLVEEGHIRYLTQPELKVKGYLHGYTKKTV